jgi:hypothetical protein
MVMKPFAHSSPRRGGLIALTLFLAVSSAGLFRGEAQQPALPEGVTPPPPPPRVYGNLIPGHVPLKVKVRNLNNERWARDLEVEVTNHSDKPIYFLKISILPGMKGDSGYDIAFPLRYGRPELVDLEEQIAPDDVPIPPGESYVFKIPEKNWRAWEFIAAKKKLKKNEPRKINIEFNLLNFGDGTGYVTTGAKPVTKKVSQGPELHALGGSGVESISLDYRESRRRDGYGNGFRYRAKVNGRGAGDAGRWAYDVFLIPAP